MYFDAIMFFRGCFFQYIKAYIVMLKIVHILQRVVGEQAQKAAHGTSVHAYQHGLLGFCLFYLPKGILLSAVKGNRCFTTLHCALQLSGPPGGNYFLKLSGAFFAGCNPFHGAPVYFIQSLNDGWCKSLGAYKWLNGLVCALKAAHKDEFKGHISVGPVKQFGLLLTCFIEG